MNNLYKKINRGFSLAEVVVCLAVIGVITMILMPVIDSMRPDKIKSMAKKAYYLTARNVYQLINDETLYPSDDNRPGLKNTALVKINNTEYADLKKFSNLFASKLNIVNNIWSDANHSRTFTTTDGIYWKIIADDLVTTETPNYANKYKIEFDVNGKSGEANPATDKKHGPDCLCSDIVAGTCEDGTKADTFQLVVDAATGKITTSRFPDQFIAESHLFKKSR